MTFKWLNARANRLCQFVSSNYAAAFNSLERQAAKLLNTEFRNKMVRVVGNTCAIVSAVGVTISIEYATKPHLFVTYLIGAIAWTIIGLAIKDRYLAQLNAVFIILNAYAIYVRM